MITLYLTTLSIVCIYYHYYYYIMYIIMIYHTQFSFCWIDCKHEHVFVSFFRLIGHFVILFLIGWQKSLMIGFLLRALYLLAIKHKSNICAYLSNLYTECYYSIYFNCFRYNFSASLIICKVFNLTSSNLAKKPIFFGCFKNGSYKSSIQWTKGVFNEKLA